MKQLILLFLFIPCTLKGKKSVEYYQTQFYSAYINGNIEYWRDMIGEMKDQYDQTKSTKLLKQIVVAQYGYVAYQLSWGKEKKAKPVLEEAKDNIEYLLKFYPEDGELYALRAATTGFTISMNMYKAPFDGPQSLKDIEKAIELSPNHPSGYIQEGNAFYYMPGFLGGSKQKAIKNYEKAMQIFDQQPTLKKNNWEYINLMSFLGRAYAKEEMYDKAEQMYKRILRLEPDFDWVKNELYPQLKEQMNN